MIQLTVTYFKSDCITYFYTLFAGSLTALGGLGANLIRSLIQRNTWNAIAWGNDAYCINQNVLFLTETLFILQVKHFDRKREYLKFKERIQNDGYDPLDEKAKTKSWLWFVTISVVKYFFNNLSCH